MCHRIPTYPNEGDACSKQPAMHQSSKAILIIVNPFATFSTALNQFAETKAFQNMMIDARLLRRFAKLLGDIALAEYIARCLNKQMYYTKCTGGSDLPSRTVRRKRCRDERQKVTHNSVVHIRIWESGDFSAGNHRRGHGRDV